MATSKAKKEARDLLGSFDTSGYDSLKSSAKSTYDTSVADAGNQWNNLQQRLTANRKASATDFSRGRSSVSESDYLANRADTNRRTTGGLDTNSFNIMNNLSNRMELGRQYSDLANTYYNALEGIDREQAEGQQAYDMALRQAGDIYNSALANIDLAKQGAQNQYNAQLASLAEGIQSRWDANANAAAALAAQREQYESDLALKKSEYINQMTNELNDKSDDRTILNTYEKLRYLGLSDKEIQRILKQQTGLNNLNFIVNNNGNVALTRLQENPGNYYNASTGATTPFTLPTSSSLPISTSTSNLPYVPIPTPYQDLLNKSNSYFNR